MSVDDPGTAQLISNLGLASAALTAAAGAAWTASRCDREVRSFWAFLAASAFSWGVGQSIWTYFESVSGLELPFPSLADVGYLGAVPLAVIAMLSLPSGTPTLVGRWRTVIDGAIVALSLLGISWELILGDLFRSASGTLLETIISLAYPLGDIISVTIVAYVMLRARETNTHPPVPLGLVGLALIAIGVADSGFTLMTAAGTYASGSAIDIGWCLGYVLILMASRVALHSTTTDDEVNSEHAYDSDSPGSMLMPYAALLLLVLVGIVSLIDTGALSPFVTSLRTGILILIIVRQFLASRELSVVRRAIRERTDELYAIRHRYEGLALHASDVVAIVDTRTRVSYVSGSIKTVFEHDPDEVLDRPLTDLLREDYAQTLTAAVGQAAAEAQGTRTVEVEVAHSLGTRWAEMTVTNQLDNPHINGLIVNCHDVSERKILEEQLLHLAFHDSLTALANRPLFKERVEEALKADYGGKRVAVLFLDLDGFKQVNDSLGHAAGDLLLVMVSERLRTCVRASDIVARLGGDEFAVLLPDVDNEAAPRRTAERIIGALVEPFELNGRSIVVGGSIGIARTKGHPITCDELLRNADLAMYRAKSRAGSAIEVFEPQMHTHLVRQLQTEGDLRAALDNEEFELHYQPTIELRTGRIIGVEALIRWSHPDRGLIPPLSFIPIAEATGLIRDIGRWVLTTACRQMVHWQQEVPGYRDLTVAVNLSGKEITRPGLLSDVGEVLRETGLDPACLMLEMTESVLFEHDETTLKTLDGITAMGVRLAVDDFGTGYSSLAYLHRFPADVLKIDRSFVERITGPAQDSELVNTIVRLGRSLDMTTIAEGIENASQMEVLRQLGCEHGQGYHLARPLSAQELTTRLVHTATGASTGEAEQVSEDDQDDLLVT
ncbi:putative bifunctional diguanylate cyclase/phosphodiesterase [Euzebya tangerina]|uniref:putative bifunctional diguanylate cyclase/phosphodiesterase n=1 Tax=Euzebya tangerina TaxID=591198 RepID=UPI0013C2BE10|nr:EAL domain-containing protein [Euzebya tangerina]